MRISKNKFGEISFLGVIIALGILLLLFPLFEYFVFNAVSTNAKNEISEQCEELTNISSAYVFHHIKDEGVGFEDEERDNIANLTSNMFINLGYDTSDNVNFSKNIGGRLVEVQVKNSSVSPDYANGVMTVTLNYQMKIPLTILAKRVSTISFDRTVNVTGKAV